jgi:hypothetical protein
MEKAFLYYQIKQLEAELAQVKEELLKSKDEIIKAQNMSLQLVQNAGKVTRAEKEDGPSIDDEPPTCINQYGIPSKQPQRK